MSKYKVGDKFIVEIEEIYNGDLAKHEEHMHLHRIKGFNSLVLDEYGLDKLQQINPKLKIEDIDDMLAEHDLKKEAYEKGLQDAWKLARKIVLKAEMGGICYDDFKKIFGVGDYMSVLRTMTPQQALAKIEAYEKEKAIKVGDVVYADDEPDSFGVVTWFVDDKYAYVLWDDGSSVFQEDAVCLLFYLSF